MKTRAWINTRLASLNPEMDYAQMVDLLLNWRDSNPLLHHLLFNMSFARQVADPVIAEIVVRNGAGPMIRATAARVNESMQFFGTWYRYGADSEKGRESIERMNKIHSRFPITNEQFLYTLATIVVLPVHVYATIGAPKRPEYETKALVNFWQEVGTLMHLHSIPSDYEAFERYYDEYERKNFSPSRAGTECLEHLIDDFATRWYPNNTRKGRDMFLALFDKSLRSVFNIKYPGTLKTYLYRSIWFWQGVKAKFTDLPREPRYVVESFAQ